MKVTDETFDKTLARFDSLDAEGRNLADGAEETAASNGLPDEVKFAQWRTKVATLLAIVIRDGHIHRGATERIVELQRSRKSVLETVGFLRGVKNDLKTGFLDDLATKIEAEIASDYLGQAGQLLDPNHNGRFHHVPAAVLAGAVLEKSLRTLCGQQQPPIELKTKGKFKMMNDLVGDLKAAKVLNHAQSTQLRAWMVLRNHAAHGEFEQLKRDDVEAMVTGIKRFITDHLK